MTSDDFHKHPTQPGVPSGSKQPSIPELPLTIGEYKIESLLEKGGMSILYLATHPVTKEPVTIKVLSPKFLSQPDVVQRFFNEAEIIAMADHPNIVKMYGHGKWEGGLYIAMEFIQGISLRQYILQTPMSLKHALEVVIDIAYALCHLHTHGVIHRDLKPENILMTDAGGIKVIDFGIAQLLTEQETTHDAAKQRLIGTPIYMSPEQRENPENVSFPSDIYSLGIITYEMILGKLSHGQIHISLMPKGIQKILNKALQPNPDDRYQDVVDFITDVSAYMNSGALQKEKKVGDRLSELSENLRQAQIALMPATPPQWSGIEAGLTSHIGTAVFTTYFDFFELPDESFGIIMGEPTSKEPESILYTAVLRGMVRSLSRLTTSPAELMTILNEHVIKDPMNQAFALHYLVLSPKKNQACYISCGYGSLWHIQSGQITPQRWVAENIALGIDAKTQFTEIKHPWQMGDTLLLAPFAFLSEAVPLSESFFQRIIMDYIDLPPQKQVDNIVRKITIHIPRQLMELPVCLIALYRT